MPEYGMGFDVRIDEPDAAVDPYVEMQRWNEPLRPRVLQRVPVWFVDGVRRIDLHLLADADGRRVPGLFGSLAVGGARCDERAIFGEPVIGRRLVLGGGTVGATVTIRCGSEHLVYQPEATTSTEPDAPLIRLQDLMRQTEGLLAARLAADPGVFVLADGPLTFFDATPAPVVGVVKRFGRVYLDDPESLLIPRLGVGERTPLFAIEAAARWRKRLAWYTRVAPVRGTWHDHAGVARCEIRDGFGLGAAATVADRVSALLPTFAGRPNDPRTPQNLMPVAGLESWLRHRLGAAPLVRRTLMSWITETQGVAV
jgi:hypothetical protein